MGSAGSTQTHRKKHQVRTRIEGGGGWREDASMFFYRPQIRQECSHDVIEMVALKLGTTVLFFLIYDDVSSYS